MSLIITMITRSERPVKRPKYLADYVQVQMASFKRMRKYSWSSNEDSEKRAVWWSTYIGGISGEEFELVSNIQSETQRQELVNNSPASPQRCRLVADTNCFWIAYALGEPNTPGM